MVARVRPLLKNEIDKDVIVTASSAPGDKDDSKSIVRIPNPKKESELYTFQFSSVYDQAATQADIFDNEVSPTVKHLFKGFDVTLFAYGVTGTGKTHTMRGGKSMAERGVIPRLLSSIYRRARKVEKDTAGETQVEVAMSYYEIYNDRVFDLFEPPEKRTPAGLPIRDNQSGKAVVVGLTERPCTSLKEFEQLYDQANVNRSTSATKLNAHSSRSHAVLCVKITQITGEEVRVSTASAIDLAGSEDNRRTDNNKDRLVESSAINKSLFVLASCVEAISKKQTRVPYRESKMTRILALGQNNGLTVMILNLAPVRSYHLDTLSSLNFANRTKKIEVNEIENQPFFRDAPAAKSKVDSTKDSVAPAMNRQPLRPKILSHSSHLQDVTNVPKPAKSFAVFSDKPRAAPRLSPIANTAQARQSRSAIAGIKSPKRVASREAFGRPTKAAKQSEAEAGMSQNAIEALIERKVMEALAGRAEQTTSAADPISDEVQKRLDALEKRIEGQETERAEGLQYPLMAKQHQVRGEDVSALKMYQLALPHFPGNEKLVRKMSALQDKIDAQKAAKHAAAAYDDQSEPVARPAPRRKQKADEDESYHEGQAEEQNYDEEEGFVYRPRTKIRRPALQSLHRAATSQSEPEMSTKSNPPPDNDSEDELAAALTAQTPRTRQLLEIINTKDVSQIKLLKGVGAKKAEAIVNCLCDLDDSVTTLGQLGKLKGVGVKTVENMRTGLQA